ncbi:hypothetical protein BOX15_Mlig028884g1 [Macrostomum lignano]|uniref:Uncharacterized protein n=1 Tax=Macrostomum lignano TaxID=282301 RepID=A0A267FTG5_9PLAT|nr:hypothetical protein BOX15_Mlig028884g2 [Macrostomum lignano]PAA91596.1 hypothetical protein BOX15_Mlig028884g3 [Macrostomum lignano]PAA91675.1 hypothetical protein BOX15_Mlig028884g1 [Macrostomum lignano]
MAATGRRPTASEILGSNFSGLTKPTLQVSAPECPGGWERLGELSIVVESPPLRVGPPGHESFVRLADVEDDPNQELISCEEEYSQERRANLRSREAAAAGVAEADAPGAETTVADDDVTTIDPNEALLDELVKEVDLQRLITKCLRTSVRHTKTADRTVRLSSLKALRGQHAGLTVAASSNLESDDEDEDDLPDD